MFERIKRYFVPVVSDDVQRGVDSDSIKNLYQLAFAVMIFELATLIVYLMANWPLNQSEFVSVGSVLLCASICLTGYICAGRMMKRDSLSHVSVTVFTSIYYFVFSIWSAFVSYRQYIRGEQLVTFYAVELSMVCFIPLKPLVSMALVSAVHACLYATLFSVDGAQGINLFNYAVYVLVSIAGMIVRHHSQIRMSEKSVELQNNNDLLAHISRHDDLTKLKNRKALDEDIPQLVGNHVSAYMIDINYFKEINDTYGHVAGDLVLVETAMQIERLFCQSHCYRYGGDEFLVLDTGKDAFAEDTYVFPASTIPGHEILLSIGRADGSPRDRDQLFQMIDQADIALYGVKRKTHSPEFEGHDRRRP